MPSDIVQEANVSPEAGEDQGCRLHPAVEFGALGKLQGNGPEIVHAILGSISLSYFKGRVTEGYGGFYKHQDDSQIG